MNEQERLEKAKLFREFCKDTMIKLQELCILDGDKKEEIALHLNASILLCSDILANLIIMHASVFLLKDNSLEGIEFFREGALNAFMKDIQLKVPIILKDFDENNRKKIEEKENDNI